MELVHNYYISLGLVLQRERQGHDEESSVRRNPLRLQGGVEEVPILVTLRSQDLARKWTDRQLEPATDANQLFGCNEYYIVCKSRNTVIQTVESSVYFPQILSHFPLELRTQ